MHMDKKVCKVLWTARLLKCEIQINCLSLPLWSWQGRAWTINSSRTLTHHNATPPNYLLSCYFVFIFSSGDQWHRCFNNFFQDKNIYPKTRADAYAPSDWKDGKRPGNLFSVHLQSSHNLKVLYYNHFKIFFFLNPYPVEQPSPLEKMAHLSLCVLDSSKNTKIWLFAETDTLL